ncbi:hypothetical protein TeGR_g10651 [Tetraparma gracilis]|uniref:Uncharacterized protein n=1 Tax=Tetraparma gracilis TaxID=2962635 RepID=A0ABQ6N952_9STRA|nr:hypothetical protein TeGR_g10651 [Tetraparma gracilis]
MVVVYSVEPDEAYQERVGKEEQFDSDSEGELVTDKSLGKRSKMVSHREYEQVKSDFSKVLKELESERLQKQQLEEKLKQREKEVAMLTPKIKEKKDEQRKEKKKVDEELGAMLALMGR